MIVLMLPVLQATMDHCPTARQLSGGMVAIHARPHEFWQQKMDSLAGAYLPTMKLLHRNKDHLVTRDCLFSPTHITMGPMRWTLVRGNTSEWLDPACCWGHITMSGGCYQGPASTGPHKIMGMPALPVPGLPHRGSTGKCRSRVQQFTACRRRIHFPCSTVNYGTAWRAGSLVRE